MKVKEKIDLAGLSPAFLNDKKANALRYSRLIHDGYVLSVYQDTGNYRIFKTNESPVRLPFTHEPKRRIALLSTEFSSRLQIASPSFRPRPPIISR